MLFQTKAAPRMMHRAIRHSFGMSINLDQITPDMQRILYEHLTADRAVDGKDFRTIAALTRRGLIRCPSRAARPKYTIITRLGRATAAVLLGMEADALTDLKIVAAPPLVADHARSGEFTE